MGRSVSYPSGAVVAFDKVDFEDRDDFEWYLEDFVAQLERAYPAAYPVNRWIGREDRAVMANRHAYFGISEYCGLVAVWVVAREDAEQPGLAEQWVASIEDGFLKRFGSLARVGSMSNGQSVYVSKDPQGPIAEDLAGDSGHVVIGGLLCG